jgi:hypothetical protein
VVNCRCFIQFIVLAFDKAGTKSIGTTEKKRSGELSLAPDACSVDDAPAVRVNGSIVWDNIMDQT